MIGRGIYDHEAEKRANRLLVAALGICATGRQTASSGLAKNARDTIKAQDAEIERLREALEDIESGRGMFGVDTRADLIWAMEHARAALRNKGGDDE